MTLAYWSISIAIFAVIVSRGKSVFSTNNYINEYKNSTHCNKSLLLLFLVWVVYSILLGCRKGFVDTATYKLMAERIGASFSNLFNSELAIVEPGFNAWMVFCNKISGSNSQFFIFLTTAVTLAGVLIFFHKESSDSALSIFFFIAFISFTYMNGIRQAMVAVVFALVYSRWKYNIRLMILTCILLTSFHSSSLLLIPLYLCINGKVFNWKIKMLFLFSVLCVIGAGSVQRILNIILNDRFSESLNLMTSGTGMVRVVINLIPVALVAIQYRIGGIRENRDKEIANIFLVDAAINICSLKSTYFARMSVYFVLLIAAYYPRVLHRIFNRRSQKIVYILFVIFYTAFYLYQAYTFEVYGYLRTFHLFFLN